jgi:hypothetical protein
MTKEEFLNGVINPASRTETTNQRSQNDTR